MEVTVSELRKKFEGKVNFVLLDVYGSEGRAQAEYYRITAVPTFIIFDNEGKERKRIIGPAGRDVLEEQITKL